MVRHWRLVWLLAMVVLAACHHARRNLTVVRGTVKFSDGTVPGGRCPRSVSIRPRTGRRPSGKGPLATSAPTAAMNS